MLGQYLKQYRIKNNLTQKEMADLCGTDQTYYSRIETGDVKPGFIMVKRLASAVKVEESFIRGLL